MRVSSVGRLVTRIHRNALGIFAVAVLFYAALSLFISLRIGRSVGELSVFFDGHLYLSIARSFPLPYSAEGIDYAGHSPGYPAVAWLIRLATPSSLVNWGEAMLMALWIPAGAAVALFFLVAQKLEADPWVPTLAFALANPVWLLSAATPHAEPVAIALLLGALLAHLSGRTAIAGIVLALAVLTRLPSAVLGAWLFFGILAASQFRLRPNLIHAFGSLAAFGLLNAYLYWRIPAFEGIAEAHSVFWNTSVVWPFVGLIKGIQSDFWPSLGYETTYGLLTLYVVAMGAALWTRDRMSLELGLWVLMTAGAAASFRGIMGVWDYPRLSIPAWPAALLIVARSVRHVRSRAATGIALVLIAVAASVGLWSLLAEGRGPYQSQLVQFPWLEREMKSLDRDAPRWVDFRAFHRRAGVPGRAVPRLPGPESPDGR